LAQALNGTLGGGGGAGSGEGGGGGEGGGAVCDAVTVNARSPPSHSAAQYRAQVASPSSRPGQPTEWWLDLSARSIVRALTSRFTIALTEPCSELLGSSAPPSVGSPARSGGVMW
jgi:hypothetical protein